MRALVLLVVCFLLLAALQAGYLVVEARRSHRQLQIVDDAEPNNHGNEHAQWQPSGKHPKDKGVDKLVDDRKTNEVGFKMHVGKYVVQPKTEGDDGKIHDRNYHNKKHRVKGDKTKYVVMPGEKTNTSEPVHTYLHIHLHEPGNDKKHHNNTVIPKVEELNQGSNMYYGKMMSDQAHPARHQANSYNRKKHKKTDKKGKHKCKSDKECDPDKCCVEKWNGRAVCRKSNKGLNRKCSSDCMCMAGLKCSIEINHKAPQGKRHMGRCIDPHQGELSKPHFTFQDLQGNDQGQDQGQGSTTKGQKSTTKGQGSTTKGQGSTTKGQGSTTIIASSYSSEDSLNVTSQP